MLISLSHRFLFVANIRNASLAVELALRPLCDIVILETSYGKHEGVATIQDRYSFIFRHMPIDRFVVFGVMRKPVDFVLSVYNNHSRAEFEGAVHSTKDMTFDEFWTSWRQQHGWMLVPQHQRFLDREGKVAVNFIIDFDRLQSQIAQLFMEAYGVNLPLELQHLNVSPKVLTVDQLTPAEIEDIGSFYAEDIRLLNESTGRWLGACPDMETDVKARLKHDVEQRIVVAKEIADLQAQRLTLPALQQRIRRLEGEVVAWRRRAPVAGELPDTVPLLEDDRP